MPVYRYECSECSHFDEVFHKTILRGQNIVECPKCKNQTYHKCIGTGKMFMWGRWGSEDHIDKGIT